MSDELTGVFDHLTPDDFVRETSASSEEAGNFTGNERFETFKAEQLQAVRLGFNASDGRLNPVGVLASSTVQRVFVPDDDESIGHFLGRIQLEARQLQAHWMFYAMVTQVAPVEVPDDQQHNADDPAIQALINSTNAIDAIVWHVQSTEAGNERTEAGFMPIEQQRVKSSTSSPIREAIGVLGEILPPRA